MLKQGSRVPTGPATISVLEPRTQALPPVWNRPNRGLCTHRVCDRVVSSVGQVGHPSAPQTTPYREIYLKASRSRETAGLPSRNARPNQRSYRARQPVRLPAPSPRSPPAAPQREFEGLRTPLSKLGRMGLGAGRPRRSTLPLGVSGRHRGTRRWKVAYIRVARPSRSRAARSHVVPCLGREEISYQLLARSILPGYDDGLLYRRVLLRLSRSPQARCESRGF